jgi:hypothetical protein
MAELQSARGYKGALLRRGDRVIYPGRQSSSLYLTEGVITDIGFRSTYSGGYEYLTVARQARYSWEKDGREVQIRNLSLVIPYPPMLP